ncbi:tRNA dimethylallyltransferase [Pseudonocardia sp. ICBG601]|uniref:tRNA dimethylallyltransferase n=1 Tax=Pseudonocardia sp. ICBG601 TaxID=2846759 RepID=UPI0027E31CD5|nr:tRNA dimethylallyltransferase [Pseudonocardia sp. ICBG601]
MLVGGSGLYVQAVLDELEFPGTDPELRAALEAELERDGSGALHAPPRRGRPGRRRAGAALERRRIVRALEVIALTGRPFRATLPGAGTPRYDAVLLGVDRDVAELDERVALRVDRMLDDGLVDETPRAAPRAGSPTAAPRPARWATGR